MLAPIPELANYGISAEHGFLPAEPPLERLTDPYYARWESVVTNLQALILSRRLRQVVKKLPILSTGRLQSEAEWRRAYSLLAFLTHGYIWGGDRPEERIPPPLSVPLLEVCSHLELPPVATYAALCLWNFKPIFDDEPIDSPENLATLTTFTGSLDESWFYLISVAIEARGGPLLQLVLDAMRAARHDDASSVTSALQTFAERLDEIGTLLNRMYESCDPHVFYHRIRPFLAGSNNMGDAGLPDGVLYEDGSGQETFRRYGGGSNAQSSLIQFFDIALGVEHRPTGLGPPRSPGPPHEAAAAASKEEENDAADATRPPPQHSFIHEMRRYMPGPHARFLNDVTAASNLRAFATLHSDNKPLSVAYDACLAMLRALRDKHIRMVSRYIVVKSREARHHSRSLSPRSAPPDPLALGAPLPLQPGAPLPLRPGAPLPLRPGAPPASRPVNIASATTARAAGDGDSSGSERESSSHAGRHRMRGTGGTALIPFLKQARDETAEPAVDAWARKLLGGAPVLSGKSASRRAAAAFLEPLAAARSGVEMGAVGEHADGDRYIVGLAGTWGIDDADSGGICHW